MVHLWVSLENNKIRQPCLNRRVVRIFKDGATLFYGDYCLDIYVATKHDYDHLEAVVRKVSDREHEREKVEHMRMKDIIGECGYITHTSLPKIFPSKDGESLWEHVQCEIYRNDGNFKLFAFETTRFYYVIRFVTG